MNRFVVWQCISTLQVDHNLLCSPFCLVHTLFAWLPSGTRKRLTTASTWRVGLPSLDGLTIVLPNAPMMPAGRCAIPYLLYLLTLHPMIMLAYNAIFYVYTPFGKSLVHWVCYGTCLMHCYKLGAESSSPQMTLL